MFVFIVWVNFLQQEVQKAHPENFVTLRIFARCTVPAKFHNLRNFAKSTVCHCSASSMFVTVALFVLYIYIIWSIKILKKKIGI